MGVLDRGQSDEELAEEIVGIITLPKRTVGVPRKHPYQDHSVFSLFPRLPKDLDRLAETKMLADCYRAGNYLPIPGKKSSRRKLTALVPVSVFAKTKLLHLFAKGEWDDFVTCSLMHTWETLGRAVLQACGGAKSLTEALAWLTKSC